ncbi:DHA2 family efflux MFS transporter permease subunit [Candidatus Falkowbacteria bacterium]|nr:DHA2 family efflux MFS transporter permease subunit [Candidatus Falkowbacteria bacterium]
MSFFSDKQLHRYRWFALFILALGLAIVIIDGTVLNVSLPYIIRDLNTSLSALEWVLSGYALIISALLITSGRLGDMYGRKRIFLLGVTLFAAGSFIASEATNVLYLFLGEAIIEAIGASMMITSSLSLLVNEFSGKERAVAFGIWGAVAGGASALGPLLGGYLTTFHSWRWSLRINVFIGILVLLGSVFIKETKGDASKKFDWPGTATSSLGMFSLVFALIEGQKLGWWAPKTDLSFAGWQWPLQTVSIIPFALMAAAYFISLFIYIEKRAEANGGSPLLQLSIFKNKAFSFGLTVLLLLSLSQMGVFFILPIFLQSALDMTPLNVGIMLLSSSVSSFIAGSISGLLANRLSLKKVILLGIGFLTCGIVLLIDSLSLNMTSLTLAPALIIYGIGIGTSSAQLTNLILSSAPAALAGESSAINATARQLGASFGISLIGLIFSSSLTFNFAENIRQDPTIPPIPKYFISSGVSEGEIRSLTGNETGTQEFSPLEISIRRAQSNASLAATKNSLIFSGLVMLVVLIIAAFMPAHKREGS